MNGETEKTKIEGNSRKTEEKKNQTEVLEIELLVGLEEPISCFLQRADINKILDIINTRKLNVEKVTRKGVLSFDTNQFFKGIDKVFDIEK